MKTEMEPKQGLTQQDYETSRNRTTYKKWLDDWQSKLLTDRNLAEDYRKRTDLWRQFTLEAIPIGRFIAKYPDWPPEGSIRLQSGSQAFDAEVAYSSGKFFFIEVTSTEDIVSAYKREYLNKHDEHDVCPGDPVGINSKADLQKARKQSFPLNPSHVLYGNSGQESELRKIVERTKAKLAKKHYKQNTVLIVNSIDRILDKWTDIQIQDWLSKHLGTNSSTPFRNVWLTLEDERCIQLL